MPAKSFFNDGQTLVVKSLEGLCSASPELVFNRTTKSQSNTCCCVTSLILCADSFHMQASTTPITTLPRMSPSSPAAVLATSLPTLPLSAAVC